MKVLYKKFPRGRLKHLSQNSPRDPMTISMKISVIKGKILFLAFMMISICLSSETFGQTGKTFWFAAPDIALYSTSNYLDRPIFLRVTALGKAAIVVISEPANAAFIPITQTISANSSYSFDLTSIIDQIENTGVDAITNNGLKITSNENILAYYEITAPANPDLFALKGDNALGTSFIIPSQKKFANAGYTNNKNNMFFVIAQEDNTQITITPSVNLTGHLQSAGSFVVSLNEGQVYGGQAASTSAAGHLGGTFVESTKPVAITAVDDLLAAGGCADVMGDQLVPINLLGKKFITMPGYLTNATGIPNLTDIVYIWAVDDGTTVSVDGVPSTTLNKGQYLELISNNQTFYIETGKPVMVYQVSGFACEVGGGVIPQIDCTGSTTVGLYRSTSSSYYVNLLVKTGGESSFTFNGGTTVILLSDFQTVPNSGGVWKYAKKSLTLTEFPLGASAIVENSVPFHLGVVDLFGGGGEFGYFSDFGSFKPEVSISNAGVCADLNTSALLSTPFVGSSYQWYKDGSLIVDATSSSYVATVAGDYTVSVVYDALCAEVVSQIKKVSAFCPNPIAADSIKGCGSAELYAGSTDFLYSWNTGATTPTITVNQNGWYTVTVTDEAISYLDSIHVSISKADIINSNTTACKSALPDTYVLSIDSLAVGTNVTRLTDLSVNLRNGLIAYYTLNGNSNDLVSGGTANGVATNTTSANNRFAFTNNAAGFLKASSSRIVTQKLATGVSDNFTYSVYVNPATTTALPPTETIGFSGFFGTQCVIHPTHGANFGNKDLNAGSGLYVGTNGLYVSEHSDGYVASPLVYTGDLTGWHMITIVYDNKIPKLYIDGKYIKSGLANTRTIYPSIGYDPTSFGDYSQSGFGAGFTPGGSPQYFSGSLDDICFYNRPLSSSDVYELYYGTRTALWSTGATTNSISVSPEATTTYSVKVSNGIVECTDNVTVTITPPLEIIAGDITKLVATYDNVPNIVDPTITVTYASSITNALVVINKNQQTNDVLDIEGALPLGVTKSYNATTGVLAISGTFSAADLQSIFRKVTFATNTLNILPRELTFTLGNAVPNDDGHYYEYVGAALSWTNAKAAAELRNLFGKQGYLSTITSQEENNYIRSKLTGDGWIGLSDDYPQINLALGSSVFNNQSQTDGKFYWVTGPEKGRLATSGNVSPITQPGMYGNWGSGEPNGAGGAENFTQLYTTGVWNDLSNASLLGYVVEYGDPVADPCEKFSFTKSVLADNQLPVIVINQSATIDEHTADGTTVLTVAATDAENAVLVSWAIVGGNTNNAFVINATTGVITVNNSLVVNYETSSVFTLTVTVSDGTSTSIAQTVTINLNNTNDVPVVSASQTFSLNENSAGSATVGTASASDQDVATIFSNWTIVSGNTNNAFSINPETGVISVNDETALNFETTSSFLLIVTVSDGIINSGQQTISIHLNDINELPVIAPNQSLAVDENSTNGTIVGTVTATDPDDGATLTWSIVGGDTDNRFSINPITGEITVNNAAALDYEAITGFVLQLSVTDGDLTSVQTVGINLNNENDNVPVILATSNFNIDEDKAIGTVVARLEVSDADLGIPNNIWTIESGNVNDAFSINSTGEIIINTALDYETITSYTLAVSVHDGAHTSLVQTIVIDINDINIAPTTVLFSATTFDPSLTPEDVLGIFTTTDIDDAEFTYELISGNGDQDNSMFILVGDKLYLKDNRGLSGLTSFTIRVRSRDSFGNTVESEFTLNKSGYDQVDIAIPGSFSPNGDGINDTWVAGELRFYNDVVVEVFDRSGVPLFKTTNPELGWDGKANGGRLLEGPFFYIIHINEVDTVRKGVIISLK